MAMEKVFFVIDDTVVEATPGQKVIDAADAAGIYIPRLCHLKDLTPAGHCRLCTVMVNNRPVSACTTPVEEGMMVENNTEFLNQMRRSLLEIIFIEGNHYCPTCEESGNCELQALAYRLGMKPSQYPYLNPKREVDATHPDIYLDRNRCVICGRCNRASTELDGKGVFWLEGRGINTAVTVDSPLNQLGDTSLEKSDRAAGICPVGCIVEKRTAYRIPVGQRQYDAVPIGAEIEAEDVTA